MTQNIILDVVLYSSDDATELSPPIMFPYVALMHRFSTVCSF
jgi:hypothetical protein